MAAYGNSQASKLDIRHKPGHNRNAGVDKRNKQRTHKRIRRSLNRLYRDMATSWHTSSALFAANLY